MNAAEITDKLGLHSLRNRNWYIQVIINFQKKRERSINLPFLANLAYGETSVDFFCLKKKNDKRDEYCTTNLLIEKVGKNIICLIFTLFFQATCATSGDGLYEGLDWLSNQLKNANR